MSLIHHQGGAEGRDLASVTGLSWRKGDGTIVHNEERTILENMDELPFVTPVYKRDLVIENYFGAILSTPISRSIPGAAANRAAPSACAADHRRASLPRAQRRPR